MVDESQAQPVQLINAYKRLSKDKATELALSAAYELDINGERLTLAAVARAAGIKYTQFTYAFGGYRRFIEEFDRYKELHSRNTDIHSDSNALLRKFATELVSRNEDVT